MSCLQNSTSTAPCETASPVMPSVRCCARNDSLTVLYWAAFEGSAAMAAVIFFRYLRSATRRLTASRRAYWRDQFTAAKPPREPCRQDSACGETPRHNGDTVIKYATGRHVKEQTARRWREAPHSACRFVHAPPSLTVSLTSGIWICEPARRASASGTGCRMAPRAGRKRGAHHRS